MKTRKRQSFSLAFLGLVWTLSVISTGRCEAADSPADSDLGGDKTRKLLWRHEDFPWLEDDGDVDQSEDVILSRDRRSTNDTDDDKSIWEEIEDFYSDKNNMAMYCVLPLLVLIYGGCSSIYCIHKCRQYLRRRKHKRLKEEDCDSLNSEKNDLSQEKKGGDLDGDRDRPISQISHAWTDLQVDPSDKQWSGQTEAAPAGGSSPLPWQVPDKAAAAVALNKTSEREGGNSSRASYLDDKLKNDDISLEEGPLSTATPTARPNSSNVQLEDTPKEGGEGSSGAQAAAQTSEGPNKNQPAPAQGAPRRPPVVKAVDPQPFEATRAHANLADYATNRSSAVKATDYSRFSDSRPIEIIPLSADPHLRVWDPLHNRPFGENPTSRGPPKIQALGQEAGSSRSQSGRESNNAMKEEMLARYDALSTFQMAKKAAEILKTNAVEKSPFQRKPNKKKHIFIAE